MSKIEMIFVEGGFLIKEVFRYKDYKYVKVKVPVNSFFIGKYQVTQKLWKYATSGVMHRQDVYGEDYPVGYCSFYQMTKFCNLLSEKHGFSRAYKYANSGKELHYDNNSDGYRIPTEMEWEFAARGGNDSQDFIYSGSNDIEAVGWYDKNTKYTNPQKVGLKLSNELGIYDMSGNIAEITSNEYANFKLPISMPKTYLTQAVSEKHIKGGHIFSTNDSCKITEAYTVDVTTKRSYLGLRLARNFIT